MTHDEFDFIMDDDNEDIRLKTFYQYWGCKESYTKALGVGLSLELKTISFMNDSNNQVIYNSYCWLLLPINAYR